MSPNSISEHDPTMDPTEILTLVTDAATYDSVVVLWVTPYGTQPVLMPRTLGLPRDAAAPGTREPVRPADAGDG